MLKTSIYPKIDIEEHVDGYLFETQIRKFNINDQKFYLIYCMQRYYGKFESKSALIFMQKFIAETYHAIILYKFPEELVEPEFPWVLHPRWELDENQEPEQDRIRNYMYNPKKV